MENPRTLCLWVFEMIMQFFYRGRQGRNLLNIFPCFPAPAPHSPEPVSYTHLALIDNMAILFAIGVAVGMSDDNDGTAGLAGLVSWLMVTTLLSTSVVAMFKGVEEAVVPAAFGKTQTQFIGILCGLIGAACYNKFKSTKLPDALSFFSGKRCVAIVTAGASLVATIILYFVWPVIYGALVAFGEAIMSTGAIGAGIYGFFNLSLIHI